MKPKFKIGDKVLYTPIIGGDSDGLIYIIYSVGKIPSCSNWVYWLEDKAGCVHEDALRSLKWEILQK